MLQADDLISFFRIIGAMKYKKFENLSVDQCIKMHKQDPEGLMRLFENAIERLIASAPSKRQARLRGMQFQADALRKLAPNPLAACIEMNKLMYDQGVFKLDEALKSDVSTLKNRRNLMRDNIVSFRPIDGELI